MWKTHKKSIKTLYIDLKKRQQRIEKIREKLKKEEDIPQKNNESLLHYYINTNPKHLNKFTIRFNKCFKLGFIPPVPIEYSDVNYVVLKEE